MTSSGQNGGGWGISLSVVVPALNEEKNLKEAVEGLVRALQEVAVDWEIILVNDGSRDGTAAIAGELACREPRLTVLHHRRPLGIGRCFQDGVALASKEAVSWFPGDAENDPRELVRYLHLLEQVDIINPFVINREVRPWGRRFLSRLYLWVINLSFGTMFHYTTGNVIYRRRVFEKIKLRADGFFYQTEALVRAARAGFAIAEVPVRLRKRPHGRSKILTPRSLARGVREYLRLLASVYLTGDGTADRESFMKGV